MTRAAQHEVHVKRLSSGYWHLRGDGVCNWAQPPYWPCSEETLREHTFPEASENFIQSCLEMLCTNCDHGTDPRTLTTCNECDGTGLVS